MHTRFVFPSVVAALVATGFFSIAAQQSDTTARGDTTAAGDTARAPQRLQPVVVEATRARQNLTRVPQAVSEVGIDEIQRGRREAGLDEALEGIPGVIAEDRGNYSNSGGLRLAIRGDLPGVQLLQDGIPLTMADGTTEPNNIDLGSAGSIEVIRGPSSVLYGNSGGGVVSVTTQFPASTPFLVHPGIQFGSNGYNRQQLKLEGSLGDFAYVANANRTQTDGFRKYGSANIRRLNLVTRSQLAEGTTLGAVFNLYDMPFGENPSTLTRDLARSDPTTVRQGAFDQGWGESGTQGQGGLNLEHTFAPGRALSTTAWGEWRSVWNPIPGRIIDLHRRAGGVRSAYQHSALVGSLPLELTAGVDLTYQHDDRREFANDGVSSPGGRAQEGNLQLDQLERVLSLAPFAQATLDVTRELALTAGLRYDSYHFKATDLLLSDGDQSGKRDLSAASPMVGLNYSPRPELNIYANFAEAYQTPTMRQLSNRPDGAGGFNQSLGPEYLHSFEVGVRGFLAGPGLDYSVTGYTSRVKDALVEYQGVGEQVFFRNAGESSRRGVELALGWRPTRELSARVAYTWQDFVYDRYSSGGQDVSGKREPGIPPQAVFAQLTHSAPWGLTSTLTARWVDSYPVNDANTESNWAFTVVGLRLSLDRVIGRVAARPFAGIDNLFDERYNSTVSVNAVGGRYYSPSAGRSFYVGFRVGAGI
ncbi:MAG TPA: TonB-dependent receptor [Gemmatimonadaceae bacterium]|jgi:iron complex outermembrane receptor protein|nr:TonB-dependent receptor [Gemmatimonadaceae bacterium]